MRGLIDQLGGNIEAKLKKACQDRGYVSIHNFEFVAANVFILLLLTWVLALITDQILRVTNRIYKRLSIYHQRNCVTYVIEIIYTSGVLFLQIKYGWNIMIYGEDTSLEERKGLSYAAVLMTGLYVFELAYRVNTHWQLAVHHMIAIGVLLVAFYNWFDYPEDHMPVIRMCCIFVLHATTEQLCFLALLLHRLLDHHQHTHVLRFVHLIAAITSYVMKTSICLVTWVLWIPLWNYPSFTSYLWFWQYVFPVLNSVMLFVQWWASTIFWALSRRFQKMMIREEDDDVIHYKRQIKKSAVFSTVDMSDLEKRKLQQHVYRSFEKSPRYITN